jgi:superfamily II DNA/RNA helicase
MFDPRTAELLQAAPGVPGLDAEDLPKALTRAYARLVSDRLEHGAGVSDGVDDEWPIDRIADTYEMIASLDVDPVLRRSAAFVAGTAQQIISRRVKPDGEMVQPPIDRDGVDASMAAALLFLAAEQYADANEAGGAVTVPRGGLREAREVGRHVRDLVRGNLGAILARAEGRDGPAAARVGRLERDALRRLLGTLMLGIEHLAAHLLSGADEPGADLELAQTLFSRVLDASADIEAPMFDWEVDGTEEWDTLSTRYPGPAHLASLLLTAGGGVADAALTRIPAPAGANGDFWSDWLRFRAETMPFVWRNHRDAIATGFHEPGRSAVLVLPTGAGKTTVSALKIAATLAAGRKVVFLAPTHALVEQLTDDLQNLFPAERFALGVSSAFDSLMVDDAQLQDIEVMTPEGCLAMLSFAPEAFVQVGLLVFDECHLLSPSRRIGRALDSVLCLLAFHAAAPDADLLLLSAMLRNGAELAAWISELTGRPCSAVELLWKPSRQARGVVAYSERSIERAEARAENVQRVLDFRERRTARSLRAAAERVLTARPWVLWGLQHNWTDVPDGYTRTRITDGPLPLRGSMNRRGVWATPNANQTAAAIALNAVSAGMKTIVFVSTKADAVRTAAAIDAELPVIELDVDEQSLFDALSVELGDRRHSIFGDGGFGAVPHNGAMLRLERKLAERVFRRRSGAEVIVATPTLAQGLNLLAEVAVLAGDKRSGEQGEREELEAHELLNAAGRAGRAGHLANGVVILIPEPIITFEPGRNLPDDVVRKLRSVLPEDDRCITLTDPLEVVLDRVMQGQVADRDVMYTVNRLAALSAADGEIAPDNLLVRSFAAYRARQRGDEAAYSGGWRSFGRPRAP